jgi:hypothetical protein
MYPAGVAGRKQEQVVDKKTQAIEKEEELVEQKKQAVEKEE